MMSSFIFGSEWEYQEENKALLYLGQPFPIYQNIVTPIGYYGFEKFGDNPFFAYGWFKMKQEGLNIQTGDSISEEGIRRGWWIGFKRPLNLPEKWVYFPKTYLYASVDSFFRLNRFWNDFYEKIDELSYHVYNQIESGKFYRIETHYLENKIRNVQVLYPKAMVLIFEKKLTDYGVRKLFIFYTLPKSEKSGSEIDQIQLNYLETDGNVQAKKYKLIYQKDSRLMK